MAAPCAKDLILVVEDNPWIRVATARLLSHHGYHVRSVRNGREAIEYLHHHVRPRLILLDLQMPVMDGWKFCEEKRRDPTLCPIPVILVSSDDNIQEAAASLHAASYLHKPVEAEALFNVVDRNLVDGHACSA
jgi:two-component system sensor kinase